MLRILIEDDCMMVVDDEYQGYDCLPLDGTTPAEANAQMDLWATEYEFDLAAAKRELAEYFDALDSE